MVKREWKSKKVALHKAHSQLPNFKCPFKTGAEKLRQAQRNSAPVYPLCFVTEMLIFSLRRPLGWERKKIIAPARHMSVVFKVEDE